MQNFNQLGLVAAVAVVTGAAVGLTGANYMQAPLEGSATLEENVHAQEGVNVKVYKNGDLVTTTENTLMEGNLSIENMITGTDSHQWDTITVGNGSQPQLGDDSLDGEWSNCGLSPASDGFDGDTGIEGKWNLTVTFDATCDNIIVNTTAQYSTGAASNEDYFAGAYLNRDINLYSGDSLTIEWSNTVS